MVSGTSRGIGRYLAERYLQEGQMVLGLSRRGEGPSHPNYRHYMCDISSAKKVEELFFSLSEEEPIDVLINNAALASMNHFLLQPKRSMEKMVSVNLLGTLYLIQEAAKWMGKRKKGRIINLSSVAVPLRTAGEAVYAATKGAIELITTILAQELYPLGILINAIAPSPIPTDLLRGVGSSKMEQLLQQLAIPRYGTLTELYDLIALLLAEQSASLTGQTLYMGGIR